MTKDDIVARVAEHTGQNKKVVAEMFDGVFEVVVQAMLEGSTVRIPRFGQFHTQWWSGRFCRDPNTKRQRWVEGRDTPRFTPSNLLRDRMKDASS